MTKDKKELMEICIEYIIIVLIVFISIQVFQIVTYKMDNLDIGNSTQEQINEFNNKCNEVYGLNNWSVYGADYTSFDPHSHPPIYFQNKYSYTCFKTGIFP